MASDLILGVVIDAESFRACIELLKVLGFLQKFLEIHGRIETRLRRQVDVDASQATLTRRQDEGGSIALAPTRLRGISSGGPTHRIVRVLPLGLAEPFEGFRIAADDAGQLDDLEAGAQATLDAAVGDATATGRIRHLTIGEVLPAAKPHAAAALDPRGASESAVISAGFFPVGLLTWAPSLRLPRYSIQRDQPSVAASGFISTLAGEQPGSRVETIGPLPHLFSFSSLPPPSCGRLGRAGVLDS